MTNNINLSQVQQNQMLDQFREIAGSDKSTGYVKLSGDKLEKAGAHRNLTYKNASEIASLNGKDNAFVRASLFHAIQKSLTPQTGESKEAAANRLNILKNAAMRLGIPFDIDNQTGELRQTSGAISNQPLERRTVRALLKLLGDADRQMLLEPPSEKDNAPTAENVKAREALISELKHAWPGIKWPQVPLGSMSLSSLRSLSNGLMNREIKTMSAVLDFCRDNQKASQVNDEDALAQLRHMQDLMKTEEGANQVKQMVTMPSDQPKAESGVEPQPKVEPGNAAPEEVHAPEVKAPQDEAPKGADATALEAQLSKTGFLSLSDEMKAMFANKNGEVDALVGHFIADVIDAGSKGTLTAETLQNHKGAIAFLIGAKDAEVDALLDRVAYGSLIKGQIQDLRDTARLMKNLPWSAIYKGVGGMMNDKTVAEIQKSLTKELNPTRGAEIRQMVEKNPKESMEGLRSEIEKIMKDTRTLEPEARVRSLVSTLRSKSKEVTALLCQPEALVKHLGSESLLLPVFTALRGKLNDLVQAKLTEGAKTEVQPGAKPGAQCDLLQIRFAGRIADEIESMLTELMKQPSLIEAFAPKALSEAQQTQNLGLLLDLIEGTFLSTGLSDEIQNASQNLGKVETQDVQNLLADLVLEQETWITDEAGKSGERIHQMLDRHLDSLSVLLCNPEKYVKSMGLPDDVLKILGEIKKAAEPLGALFGPGNEGFARVALGKSLERMTPADFAHLEELVDQATEKAMDTIQQIASVAFEGMVTGESIGDFTEIQDHLSRVSEFSQGINEGENAGKIPVQFQTRFTQALQSLQTSGKAEGAEKPFDLTDKDLAAFQKILANTTLSEDQKTELIADFRADDLFGCGEHTESETQNHADQLLRTDIGRVLDLIRNTQSDDADVRALQDKVKLSDPLSQDKTALEQTLDRIDAKLKGKAEERFYKDLEGKTLSEGFKEWAKHERYDAKTRDLMFKYLGKSKIDVNQTFKSFIGEKSINDKMAEVFKSPGFQLVKFAPPETLDANALELHRIRESTLDDLGGSGALDTKSGYGKFMVDVMKRYFSEVSPIDQRSMLSALFRFGKLRVADANATPEERSQVDKANLASLMGSLFKGAGPIMQKLLQQLGSMPLPAEFKAALADMKCNLLPIPDEMVRSQLLGIVEKHNAAVEKANQNPQSTGHTPKISNIQMNKVVGAASVGEAALCTIHFADGTSREAVIKLLRPEAENRMRREEGLFLEVARTIEGMEQTYLGRLERIKEELDFRIEASNVEKGKVYDDPLKQGKSTFNDVHSMKLIEGFEPSKGTMILERAPGTTVSSYLEASEKFRADFTTQVHAPKTLHYTRIKLAQQLGTHIQDLVAKQQQLTHLVSKWVTEGLFKNGFYHGDLHAGNIMVDNGKKAPGEADQGVTVIDFGNATKLSGSDQSRIMRMIYGVADGDAKLFLENYKLLMAPESQAKFTDEKFNTALDRLKLVFSKGSENDAGQRIAAALMELQKLDLELPAPIFNFSQCQILLQGTITQINQEIESCEKLRSDFYEEFNNPHKMQTAMFSESQMVAETDQEVLDQLKSMKDELSSTLQAGGKISAVEREFLTKYDEFEAILKDDAQKADLQKDADNNRQSTEVQQTKARLEDEFRLYLDPAQKNFQLVAPNQAYYDPVTLSSSLENILGLKPSDSHSVGAVKAKIEQIKSSVKNGDDLAKLNQLAEKIKDYPDAWSLRSPVDFKGISIADPYIQLFQQCGEPRTKAVVGQFLKDQIAEYKKQEPAYTESINQYAKVAGEIKGLIAKMKTSYVETRLKQEPTLTREQLEKDFDKWMSSGGEKFKNCPDQTFVGLFKSTFLRYSKDGLQTIDLPKNSKPIHGESVAFEPINFNKFETAVTGPKSRFCNPLDTLEWLTSIQNQIKDFGNDELVFCNAPLPDQTKTLLGLGNGKYTLGQLGSMIHEKVESHHQEVSECNQLFKELTSNTSHATQVARDLACNAYNASNSMKKAQGHTGELKTFFDLMGGAITENKWKTAKAVGAQAVLKGVWQVVKSHF